MLNIRGDYNMENINFELYKIFCIVAKHRNLTKAANELYISQPAVTQSIRKLEEELGYKLFYRVKNGMNLTENGLILYEYLKLSVECLSTGKEKIDEANSGIKKIIRIGSGTTLARHTLVKPLASFKKLYPDITVEVHSGITDNLLKMLEQDLIDLVLLNSPFKDNNELIFKVIGQAEDAFIANSKTFFEYKEKLYTFKDLNDLPLILQMNISTSRKHLDSLCSKNHVFLKPMYELASYSLVLDFVERGLGVGYISKEHVQSKLKKGDLFEIKTNFKISPRKIAIARNKKNLHNDTITKFIEMFQK